MRSVSLMPVGYLRLKHSDVKSYWFYSIMPDLFYPGGGVRGQDGLQMVFLGFFQGGLSIDLKKVKTETEWKVWTAFLSGKLCPPLPKSRWEKYKHQQIQSAVKQIISALWSSIYFTSAYKYTSYFGKWCQAPSAVFDSSLSLFFQYSSK